MQNTQTYADANISTEKVVKCSLAIHQR